MRFCAQFQSSKEDLEINAELASPSDFISELPGWRERSLPIPTEGLLSFYHYDPYSQALAKIEHGHAQDREDVGQMFERGLIRRDRLLVLFDQIEPLLYRYPEVDPPSFRAGVERAVGEWK
jgi:hypothetical protein